MAQLLKRVQPGEVIKAEMWNLAVDAINELLQSSQTTGIQVASLVPAGTNAEPIRIGTLLQITGQNFGFSIGQASVTFEWQFGSVVVTRANMLTGSSDSRLLLIVPPIPGMPQAGATMTLRVNNGLSSDTRSLFVMPVVIPLQGDVFVNWRANVSSNPNPNPLQTLQSAQFSYQIQTGINMPATFVLSADIVNATVTVPVGFVDSIEFRDESGSIISSKSLELGKSETRNIIVRIPQIPQTWANQTFSFKVTATSDRITNADSRSFTVGTPVTPSDPNITLLPTGWLEFNATTGADDPNHNNGMLTGTTIQLKPGWKLVVILDVKFGVQGAYDISIQPKLAGSLNGWTLDLVSTLPSVPANAGDSTVAQFGVTPAVGAAAGGVIVFKVKRQGATSDQSKEYNVQLMQ